MPGALRPERLRQSGALGLAEQSNNRQSRLLQRPKARMEGAEADHSSSELERIMPTRFLSQNMRFAEEQYIAIQLVP
jgi:hypothetical protein